MENIKENEIIEEKEIRGKLAIALLVMVTLVGFGYFLGSTTNANSTTAPLQYEVKDIKWSDYEARQRAALEEAFAPKTIEALKAQRVVELNARLNDEKSRAPFFVNRVEDYKLGKITIEQVVKD